MAFEKNISKNKILLLNLSLIFLLFSIVIVSATGPILLCLQKGQVAKFSLCNANMQDKYCSCTSSTCTCQLCVTENTPGIYCPASPNSCNVGSIQCTYLPGTFNNTNSTNNSTNTTTSLINVTLVTPNNDYLTQNSGMTFKYTIKNSNDVVSCGLYMNGLFVLVNSSKVRESPYVNTIAYTLSPGDYNWQIKCLSKNGVYSQSILRDIKILSSSDNPVSQINVTITQTNPLNNSNNLSGEVLFFYDVNDISNISKCNLNVNGNNAMSNVSAIINSQNVFRYNLSEGNYSWKVTCIDKTAKIWQSEARLLNIQNVTSIASPPVDGGSPSGGGGSSSGGGGGGTVSTCLTEWNCSEWSECTDDMQTRTCSYEKGKCIPVQKKPAENQTCVSEQVNETVTNQTITDTTVSKSSFDNLFTGASVAIRDRPTLIWGSIIIIIICFVFMMLIRRENKKKEDISEKDSKEKEKSEEKTLKNNKN